MGVRVGLIPLSGNDEEVWHEEGIFDPFEIKRRS